MSSYETSIQNETVVINDVEFTEEQTYNIYGIKVEALALKVSIFCIILLTILWNNLGFFKERSIGLNTIYICGVISYIFLIYSSSTLKGTLSYEKDRLVEVRQNTTTLLASLLVSLFVFENVIKLNPTQKKGIILCIFILIVLSFMISTKNTGISIATVRKPKQFIFNLVVILMAGIIYTIAFPIKN